MKFVQTLMDTAAADTDVLRALDANGDDFSIAREVAFLLLAPSMEKAEIMADFINDFSYGRAQAIHDEGTYQVRVLVNMPVTQNVILSVSGFMACIAHLFGGDYDGWGCETPRQT